MSITIINETGIVNDTKVINNKTGEEISGIQEIEICKLQMDGTIFARLVFNKVHLRLHAKVAEIGSQSSGNFK